MRRKYKEYISLAVMVIIFDLILYKFKLENDFTVIGCIESIVTVLLGCFIYDKYLRRKED
ncbi:MAG: hypothetical protein KGV57_04765 [Fusobacterium sp.]|nr:hypothetical protein [Fusobacterium sp.]